MTARLPIVIYILSVLRLRSNVFSQFVGYLQGFFSFSLLAVLDKFIESDSHFLSQTVWAYTGDGLPSFSHDCFQVLQKWCFFFFKMIILFLFYLSSVESELERPVIRKEFLGVRHKTDSVAGCYLPSCIYVVIFEKLFVFYYHGKVVVCWQTLQSFEGWGELEGSHVISLYLMLSVQEGFWLLGKFLFFLFRERVLDSYFRLELYEINSKNTDFPLSYPFVSTELLL